MKFQVRVMSWALQGLIAKQAGLGTSHKVCNKAKSESKIEFENLVDLGMMQDLLRIDVIEVRAQTAWDWGLV